MVIEPEAYLTLRTQMANFLASASLTWGLAGMGTAPHTPEPPLTILAANGSTADLSDLYLSATFLKLGPTNFLSTA